MSFLSSTPPNTADVTAKKEAIMAQVRSELALANAQELMNKVNEQCYSKCVTKPGESLSSSEQVCAYRRKALESRLMPESDVPFPVYGSLPGSLQSRQSVVYLKISPREGG
ncbi:hypothetical protein C0991_001383 [Blastosporella zonata]|nr:hypothetical protein C0991_001383 [Blastosporella zonata]